MSIHFGTGYDFGQNGSIFTNTTTTVVPPDDRKIIAIQFLSDTTFNTLSPTPQDSASDGKTGICVGDDTGEGGAGTSNTPNAGSAAGGQIINAHLDSDLTVFPKGLTIFGRWDSFSIDEDADGGVIAYLGY
tara:strand:- start:58 stop:450 length:393 start_codon:yes stop_codon:yes gene_type:complete